MELYEHYRLGAQLALNDQFTAKGYRNEVTTTIEAPVGIRYYKHVFSELPRIMHNIWK
jgi:hypothetical protein